MARQTKIDPEIAELKERAAAVGVSLAELGRRADLADTTARRIFSGKVNPQRRTYAKLRDAVASFERAAQ